MIKRVYKVKKTLSMRQFLSEFGDDFSKHMKQRLLELGTRCVLTRKEKNLRLDLKHVEHTKFNDKEYAYGQFVMNEGAMYFSDCCLEGEDVRQAPVVSSIYDALNSEDLLLEDGVKAKKVGDDNIDFVVDSILEVCPEMSPEHRAIISRY